MQAQRNVKVRFKEGEAGPPWDYLFLQRHKFLQSVHTICGIIYTRTLGCNTDNGFLNFLTDVYNKHSYPANQVHKVGETDLPIGQSKNANMKDIKPIAELTSAERGTTHKMQERLWTFCVSLDNLS